MARSNMWKSIWWIPSWRRTIRHSREPVVWRALRITMRSKALIGWREVVRPRLLGYVWRQLTLGVLQVLLLLSYLLHRCLRLCGRSRTRLSTPRSGRCRFSSALLVILGLA